MRRSLIALSLLPVVIVALLLFGFLEARSDPMVRRAAFALPHWPRGAPPVTVALLSDIRIGSAAMDAGRLTRIVAQVNELRPDLVVLAGDFINGHDSAEGAIFARRLTRPLSSLRPTLGTIAVLGNHDHVSAAAVTDALQQAGVTVLSNRSTRRGPLTVVGIDDAYTGHADPAAAFSRVQASGGAPLTVSHSPDVVPLLPAGAAPLLLMGHTHCGQGVIAGRIYLDRAIDTGEPLFAPHYRCGIVRDPGRTSVITAGLGTSRVPLRIGAPPDIWLLTLSPAATSPD
ncbi:hypothetical protein GCM10011380_12510 [Sphingomonas metalli]|uniref:Calcineurin-like phosphoesterase domain-containing protein n=1 Tax=Sphingomonas metalli TaxID=1779358 RepID=A0A916T1M3_9SPHN|nr:metallophosphoesterase [Sphingomonas metalli]GGB24440.1 hypothetical protein GCM10011380_12510 [Sphingomonas metalli]